MQVAKEIVPGCFSPPSAASYILTVDLMQFCEIFVLRNPDTLRLLEVCLVVLRFSPWVLPSSLVKRTYKQF